MTGKRRHRRDPGHGRGHAVHRGRVPVADGPGAEGHRRAGRTCRRWPSASRQLRRSRYAKREDALISFRDPRIGALCRRSRCGGGFYRRRARAGADRKGRGPARLLPLRRRRASALQCRGDRERRRPNPAFPCRRTARMGHGHLCFTARPMPSSTPGRSAFSDGHRDRGRFPWPQRCPVDLFPRSVRQSLEFAEPSLWGFVMRQLEPARSSSPATIQGRSQESRDLMAPFGFESDLGGRTRPAGTGGDRHDLRGKRGDIKA